MRYIRQRSIKRERRKIEVWQRAARILSFLMDTTPPIMYKDIREELGLSYRQVREAIQVLENLGMVHVTVISEWNGCYYVYPHHVWVTY